MNNATLTCSWIHEYAIVLLNMENQLKIPLSKMLIWIHDIEHNAYKFCMENIKRIKNFCFYSPTTLNRYAWLILVSVDTWHSYVPESRDCGDVIRNIHSSEPSVCNAWKRWSFVYVNIPIVRMCKSRFLIHDT